jgi:hypothetical protein
LNKIGEQGYPTISRDFREMQEADADVWRNRLNLKDFQVQKQIIWADNSKLQPKAAVNIIFYGYLHFVSYLIDFFFCFLGLLK